MERLSAVCKALDLSKYRIEGWIARGMIEMSQKVVPGQARLLSKKDAITITLAASLADLGMEVGNFPYLRLNRTFVPLLIGTAKSRGRPYFVVYARDPQLISSTKRGEKSASKPTKGHAKPFGEVILESVLGEFLAERPSIVLDLQSIEARVDAAFVKIENERK